MSDVIDVANDHADYLLQVSIAQHQRRTAGQATSAGLLARPPAPNFANHAAMISRRPAALRYRAASCVLIASSCGSAGDE